MLAAAERLVRGVLAALPPFSDPIGVDSEVAVPLALRVPLAAFSANRFCFDADGAMINTLRVKRLSDRWKRIQRVL